ncbi:Lytic polysaccharide monooxygenase [Lasiodiplodia theobromae]|uniref:Lytic polysaccharide monooxygenase n=1 Tax=Lasiodiplodia theobromae TaxID=45133 RepID=UPI0015C3A107|nr:Lytic polysaccharide monooxygenase [Lasiodiplodia theobromae]KAF4546360.1 Lytic polysaccharide monooxygenase [Lasiodiplodia theobromae]
MVPHMSMWMLFGLATSPLADAHIHIAKPVPYGLSALGHDLKAPISDDLSFPCHNNFNFSGEVPEMVVGEDQQLVFYPQIDEDGYDEPAVHGGGTCQLSITLDVPPTSQSTFKVIKTIEGGCPGLSNEDGTTRAVNSFTYQIPKIALNGQQTLVWTWFPVMSSDPEMYMNCAPINVSGGTQDTSAFDQLPDMLVANYDREGIKAAKLQAKEYPASGPCMKPEGDNGKSVMVVPDPGEVLERGEKNTLYATVTATGQCGKTASGGAATVGSASAESSTPQPLVTSTPAVVAIAAGGGFIETAAEVSEAAAAEAPSTTFATTTVAPPQSSGNAVAAANQASTPASATPTNGSDNSQCTGSNNGQLVCNGTTHFGICNWGKVVWQSVADGTVCENGTIKAANNARAVAEVKLKRAHGHAHERLSPVGRQFHA